MAELSKDCPIARLDQAGTPQLLLDHLNGVAQLAGQFGQAIGAPTLTHLAGLLHDLGKYRPGFQTYIRQTEDAHCEVTEGNKITSSEKTHSGAGALYLMQQFANFDKRYAWHGKVAAMLIASHHAGLYDWQDLLARMDDQRTAVELAESLKTAPAAILQPDLATARTNLPKGGPSAAHLWIRMMFSALVDADFLDTERFMDGDKFGQRNSFPTLAELKQRFDEYMSKVAATATATPVNQKRAEILQACRDKAQLPPGVFQLTVPTGGGKTLSSMAFALEHVQAHAARGMRRIIYAIPYTSIIEQTAAVFTRVFGADSFIEHHSNAETGPERETHATRLACENWDAPLVLTTNVQLFESLFAAKTSRCRKLHNIAGAVLVLDEAQLLPPDFLRPIVDTLKLLTTHYGVSVVLCTATQPALESGENAALGKFDGLNPQKIIANPDQLYQAFERVRVHLPADLQTPQSWQDIGAEIATHECVLTIVNTKKSALALAAELPADTIHLSTYLCGQHRSEIIASIRARLLARRAGTDHAPLRVISTQLIEAGVDLDFPVVYRALAGLDSIAQAAGRCNREGLLPQPGLVRVFVPPNKLPRGLLDKSASACRTVLHGARDTPLAPSLFTRYFNEFYRDCDLDKAQILPSLQACGADKFPAPEFRKVAARFKLIDDKDGVPVVVWWRGADQQNQQIDALLGMLASSGPERWLLRKLQRYTVTIYKDQAERLLRLGEIKELFPGLYGQAHDLLYDARFGIKVEAMPGDPGDYVC